MQFLSTRKSALTKLYVLLLGTSSKINSRAPTLDKIPKIATQRTTNHVGRKAKSEGVALDESLKDGGHRRKAGNVYHRCKPNKVINPLSEEINTLLLQFSSSEPSRQSLFPSHLSAVLITIF